MAIELQAEHLAEFDKIRAEHMADPPSGRIPSKPDRYARFVEPAVSTVAVKALAANPLAASSDSPAADRDVKLKAFAAAVAAKHSPGEPVSIATAADAAGTSTAMAYDFIGRLKKRGEWPYAPGVNGKRKAGATEPGRPKTPRKDGRRVGSLRLDGLELAGGADGKPGVPIRDEPSAGPPRTVVTPRPDRIEAAPTAAPAPAVSTIPIGGDLAATAARLREAADLIERAAAILKGGAL